MEVKQKVKKTKKVFLPLFSFGGGESFSHWTRSPSEFRCNAEARYTDPYHRRNVHSEILYISTPSLIVPTTFSSFFPLNHFNKHLFPLRRPIKLKLFFEVTPLCHRPSGELALKVQGAGEVTSIGVGVWSEGWVLLDLAGCRGGSLAAHAGGVDGFGRDEVQVLVVRDLI